MGLALESAGLGLRLFGEEGFTSGLLKTLLRRLRLLQERASPALATGSLVLLLGES